MYVKYAGGRLTVFLSDDLITVVRVPCSCSLLESKSGLSSNETAL